jgi:hypothetical protein
MKGTQGRLHEARKISSWHLNGHPGMPEDPMAEASDHPG